MRKILGIPHKATIFVILFAITLSIINSSAFFVGLKNTPKGTTYLGTVHYYEDFFYYINQYVQGARGDWLISAQYTSENVPKAAIYWPNILLGKFWRLFGFSAAYSYNFSVLLLNASVIIISYVFFRKFFGNKPLMTVPATIISTLATTFMSYSVVSGKGVFSPFYLWHTPHFAFDRLGATPHNQAHVITYLILLLIYFSSQTSLGKEYFKLACCFILGILFTILQPISGAILIVLLVVTHVAAFQKKNGVMILRFFFTTLGIILAGIYVTRLYVYAPYSQARLWELSQQGKTDISFLFFSLGPIAILSLIGILPFLRRKSPFSILSALTIIGTYVLFFSPIPQKIGISNNRLFSPAQYVFLGAFAAEGISLLSKVLKNKVKMLNSMVFTSIVVVIFILLSIPTLHFEIAKKIEAVQTQSVILYLPNGINQAFTTAQKIGKPEDVLLANPSSYMDVLSPALSGHTGFSGHGLMTINNEDKKRQASLFFGFSKDLGDPREWLVKNHIRYVFFTNLDGNSQSFQKTYSFLQIAYQNPTVTIFEVE